MTNQSGSDDHSRSTSIHSIFKLSRSISANKSIWDHSDSNKNQPLLLSTIENNEVADRAKIDSRFKLTVAHNPTFKLVDETPAGNLVVETDILFTYFKAKRYTKTDNLFIYNRNKNYALEKLHLYYMYKGANGMFEWGLINVYESKHLAPVLRDTIPNKKPKDATKLYLWLTASFCGPNRNEIVCGRTEMSKFVL